MSKMSDYVIELKEKAHKELCERLNDDCDYCANVKCFWCDKKAVKGRTSCAYHIGGSNVVVRNPHGDNYPIGYKPE